MKQKNQFEILENQIVEKSKDWSYSKLVDYLSGRQLSSYNLNNYVIICFL